jgi:DNA topoisomerase-6 subunit A
MAKGNGHTAKQVLGKLKELGLIAVQQIHKGKNPRVDIPLRTLSNVTFNEKKQFIEMGDDRQARYFFNVAMAKKFMQTYLLAEKCTDLLHQGKTTSIRDLFYMAKSTIGDSQENTFDEQEESDPIIEDIEVTVDALREELNLFASNKGAMVGNVTIVDQGDTIDLRRMGSGGWSIPSITEPEIIQFKKVDARFILLVEKDAMWRRLNEDKFWQKYKCILLHGQGQPPRGVRRLLYRLVNELRLPLYVFVDNDPWGYYIHSVVKQGSINLAYESQRMAVPTAKFIGLSSFDRKAFRLAPTVTIKLNDDDIRRAKQLLDYLWFRKKEWQTEIKNMLHEGVKLELEALSNRGISFVTEDYLPKKLKDKAWLD